MFAEHVLDRLDRPLVLAEERHDGGIEIALQTEADGKEDVLLAGEMMVERRGPHRQRGREIADAGGVVATLGKKPGRRLQHLVDPDVGGGRRHLLGFLHAVAPVAIIMTIRPNDR